MSYIIELVKHYSAGYGIWGIGLGMFLESLGVPVVSTVLELSAGPLIVSGRANVLAVILVADAGLVLGSVISYGLGYYGFSLFKKAEKKELYTKRELEIRKKIHKHGPKVIFFAQLVGPLRTWASYPAGALRIDFKKFVLYTALGGLIYSSLVVALSLGISRYYKTGLKAVESFMQRYVYIDVMVATILGIVIVLSFLRYRSDSDNNS